MVSRDAYSLSACASNVKYRRYTNHRPLQGFGAVDKLDPIERGPEILAKRFSNQGGAQRFWASAKNFQDLILATLPHRKTTDANEVDARRANQARAPTRHISDDAHGLKYGAASLRRRAGEKLCTIRRRVASACECANYPANNRTLQAAKKATTMSDDGAACANKARGSKLIGFQRTTARLRSRKSSRRHPSPARWHYQKDQRGPRPFDDGGNLVSCPLAVLAW